MKLLMVALLSGSALVFPAFAGEARAETGGYYYEQDSPEAKKFEASIKQTWAQGHSAKAIADGFQLNGWAVSQETVTAIATNRMRAQQALDGGLITPASQTTLDQGYSGNGPTSYAGQASYGGNGGGSAYEGGSIDMGSIPGMACGGGQAASMALGAVGAIGSWFSGGKATAPLQMAQQVQLYTANACLFSQLQAQLRGLWTQVQNLKNTDLSTINGTLSALYRVRSLLGNVDGTTYQVNRITAMMRDTYPDSYESKTDEEVMNQNIIWEEASRGAIDESWKIQAQLVQNKREIEMRTSQQVAALNRAPGILAAQQATGNLITTLIEKSENAEAANIAHYRVMEGEVAKRQAEQDNAEEMHKRRMIGWGDMGSTEVFSPFQ